jgi:hypothetical protein
MARAQHRFRNVRLTSTRRINKEVRASNRPRKAKESARRDAKIVAMIKAAKGDDYAPGVKSWICATLDKEWRQVTKDDIKTLVS